MNKPNVLLRIFATSLKFTWHIVRSVFRVYGFALMPTNSKRVTTTGSDVWLLLKPLNREEVNNVDCPKCNVRMQEFEPSPTRTILFCPLCGARIIITLTQGNSTTPYTLQAKLPRDWGEFDRVPVPPGIQHSFSDEEVLEP